MSGAPRSLDRAIKGLRRGSALAAIVSQVTMAPRALASRKAREGAANPAAAVDKAGMMALTIKVLATHSLAPVTSCPVMVLALAAR